MKTTLLTTCIASLAFSFAAEASSINFDGGGPRGHMFTTDTGTRLPIGSIVRLGTMTSSDPSSFVEFATTTINNTGGASTFTGYLRDGVAVGTPAAADAIKGKQIFLYVYNTTNIGSLDSPTVGRGLFSSTEWTLPDGFDSASTTTFNVRLGGNSTSAPATPIVNGSAIIGTYTAGPITITTGTNTNGGIYALAPAIPEPATGILALVAAAGLISRRRRTA